MTQQVAGAGGAAGTEGGAAGGTSGAPAIWTDAIQDTELRDFAINKGYNKLTAAEALPVAVGQYRNLEKLIGADKAGRTVELPNWDQNDDAGLASRNTFFDRIGRPKTPEDYKLDLKAGDKSDPELSNAFAGLLHKAGIPARSVADLATGYTEMQTARIAAANIAEQQKYAAEDKALKTEWGAKYDDNMKLAAGAAKAFGVTGEQLDTLQKATGYSTVMKMFTQIAGKMGEASWIDGSNAGGDGNKMTPAEAQVAMKAFTSDVKNREALMDKYHPKHAEAMARKSQLAAWEVGM